MQIIDVKLKANKYKTPDAEQTDVRCGGDEREAAKQQENIVTYYKFNLSLIYLKVQHPTAKENFEFCCAYHYGQSGRFEIVM